MFVQFDLLTFCDRQSPPGSFLSSTNLPVLIYDLLVICQSIGSSGDDRLWWVVFVRPHILLFKSYFQIIFTKCNNNLIRTWFLWKTNVNCKYYNLYSFIILTIIIFSWNSLSLKYYKTIDVIIRTNKLNQLKETLSFGLYSNHYPQLQLTCSRTWNPTCTPPPRSGIIIYLYF